MYGGERTNVSTDGALKWYAANGATSTKINLGIPLYGRAFENTAGIGASYSGVSTSVLFSSDPEPDHPRLDWPWYR